ncbi:MAG: DUF58 domain-containing protein [Planctomycetes bacterium]|nr:DUF58 domain-containing protein [Planctomycetota bacterium]
MKTYSPDSATRPFLALRLRRRVFLPGAIVCLATFAAGLQARHFPLTVAGAATLAVVLGTAAVVALARWPLFRRWFLTRQVRLTRAGWWFVTMTLLVFVASVNTGANLLYLLSGMLFALILVSGMLSSATFRHLRVRRVAPREARAGEPAPIRFEATNHKYLLASYSIVVEEGAPLAADRARAFFPCLDPRQAAVATVAYPFTNRGLLRLRQVIVATRYPFGFFRVFQRIDAPAEVLVLPAVVEMRLDALGAGEREIGWDAASSSARGGRHEFHGLREYREGEDPKLIHWKTSARRGALMIREMERDHWRPALLLLDTPPLPTPADAPRFEKAITFCASAALALARAGHEVAFQAAGPEGPIFVPFGAGGTRDAGEIQRALAGIEPLPARPPATGDDLGEALANAEARLPAGALLVCVTPLADRARAARAWIEARANARAANPPAFALARVFAPETPEFDAALADGGQPAVG